jgi:hypothetical protein
MRPEARGKLIFIPRPSGLTPLAFPKDKGRREPPAFFPSPWHDATAFIFLLLITHNSLVTSHGDDGPGVERRHTQHYLG